jgi:nitric oxide reductase NorQ protein
VAVVPVNLKETGNVLRWLTGLIKMESTNKEKVIEFMQGKEKCHIADISKGTGVNINSVMGLINSNILKGEAFKRLGGGFYTLNGKKAKIATIKKLILKKKEAQAQPQQETKPIIVCTDGKVDMGQFIPLPQKNGYIPRNLGGTTDVKLLENAYRNKDFLLIIGNTGLGKTHLIRHFAFMKKLPYMRVNMTGATSPEDLAGQWIPNPNPDSTAKYIWQDGVLTTFMRNGGIFCVDEINMTPADILSMCHSVTDDERRLVLTQKDGEVIHAHKDFFFASTMNEGYEGTRPLNLALKDRFRIIYFNYDRKVEEKLGIDGKLLDVADKLRESKEIMTPTSTRDLLKYMHDKENYGEKVARMFFINNFAVDEQNVIREVIELIIDNKQPKGEEQPTATTDTTQVA